MQSNQILTEKVVVWKVLENLKVHLSKAADDTPIDAAAICWTPRIDPRYLPFLSFLFEINPTNRIRTISKHIQEHTL